MSEQTAKTESDVKVGDIVNLVDPNGNPFPATVSEVHDIFGGGKRIAAAGEVGNSTGADYDADGKKPLTWHWPA